MVVYADVLVFTNLIIDYFLLLGVSKILGNRPKTFRIIISALIGALSSLYIFLPPLDLWLECILKSAVSTIMCLVAFEFLGFRRFLKTVLLLFVITFGFGGLMYAVWLIFKPSRMVINNSVVYFDISITALLVFTALGYFVFTLLYEVFSKSTPFAEECELEVYANNNCVKLRGIIDTGNSIEDIFSMGEVIICNKKTAMSLLRKEESYNGEVPDKRYRLLPCSTVSGVDMLEGVRCDKAIVKYNGRDIILKNPILAFSKTELEADKAIINPKILG